LARKFLPVGRSRIDYSADRVYAVGMTRSADNLPEFNEDLALDYDYEERVRSLSHSGYWCFGYSTTDYVAPGYNSTLDASAPLDAAFWLL